MKISSLCRISFFNCCLAFVLCTLMENLLIPFFQYADMHPALYLELCYVQVLARITTLAMKPDALRMGISSTDAALILGIAPAMAKEHLLTAESKGIYILMAL